MDHLDLKITFPCLRPELNFNLQTLVCICDGLGLLPCGQQVRITKAQTHTQEQNNKPRGDWGAQRLVPEEAPVEAGRVIVPAAAHSHGNGQPTVAGEKKIKRTFISFAADLPDFLDKYNHLPKKNQKKIFLNRLSRKVRPFLGNLQNIVTIIF